MLGSSLGMVMGLGFLEQGKVAIMLPLSFVPMMLFSGIFNKLNNISPFLRWLQYVSPYRYGVHMLLWNEYRNEHYYYVEGTSRVEYDYRADLGVDMDVWQNMGICLAVSLLFYLLSYGLLRAVNRRLSLV